MSSSRENAGSPDVETRMVGSELTIFSNIIGAFTISVLRIITQAYGDLLASPQYLLYHSSKKKLNVRECTLGWIDLCLFEANQLKSLCAGFI